MRLMFIGKDAGSQVGECPALYETDRGTYLVQGWVVNDPAALADVRDLGANETVVEIPESVLEHYLRLREQRVAAAR
jgi:hypothetical protein